MTSSTDINTIKEMTKQQVNLNREVTQFLDGLKHPFREEIEELRIIILSADSRLTENIKWNGPNYCLGNNDRITMNIQPPKQQVLIIFHRGGKTKELSKHKLIKDTSALLTWKGNDRVVATFKSMADIKSNRDTLSKIVKDWIKATS